MTIDMARVVHIAEHLCKLMKDHDISKEEFDYVAGRIIDWHAIANERMVLDLVPDNEPCACCQAKEKP